LGKMPDATKATDDANTRLNSLVDLALVEPNPMLGSNPYEPTVSTPATFIESADYSTLTLNRPALTYGFKSFGLVRTFIRQPVDDALAGGLDIEIPEWDEEEVKELLELMEEEDDFGIVKDGMTWARLFGGAGIIPVTEEDPSRPLRDDEVTEGSRLKFLAADRWELTLAGFTEPKDEFERMLLIQYGYSYNGAYNYYGVPLDDSRVFKLFGQKSPSLIRQRLQGWELSELEQCLREIQTYIKFQNLLFELVDEAKVDVYGIEDFNNQLASAEGTSLIKLRVSLGNWIKNYKNALVMDKNDTYEQKQLAFGGLADIFEEFRINLCAALRFPMNKLFGQSASGFASGEDSMENYNAMIESEVREKLRRVLRKIIGLRCRQLKGYEPKFSFKFKPLRVLNGVEEEQVKTSKQNRFLALFDRDLLSGQETDEVLHKEGLLAIETEVGRGEREPISPLEMQADAQDHAADMDKAQAKADAKKEKQNGIERLRVMINWHDRRKAA
jgi:uncharacterized protein